MSVTDKQVETLAKWHHRTYLTCPNKRADAGPWRTLSKAGKANYRHCARQLLENPPPVVREAVRQLEAANA